ncbi:MAG TPA: hypothetical protein VEL11_09745 [Candidatus Bathyarchaeia archaeon]|nr:hypothetical protein [Candidatus Bathyarchaeia archaeon]
MHKSIKFSLITLATIVVSMIVAEMFCTTRYAGAEKEIVRCHEVSVPPPL